MDTPSAVLIGRPSSTNIPLTKSLLQTKCLMSPTRTERHALLTLLSTPCLHTWTPYFCLKVNFLHLYIIHLFLTSASSLFQNFVMYFSSISFMKDVNIYIHICHHNMQFRECFKTMIQLSSAESRNHVCSKQSIRHFLTVIYFSCNKTHRH